MLDNIRQNTVRGPGNAGRVVGKDGNVRYVRKNLEAMDAAATANAKSNPIVRGLRAVGRRYGAKPTLPTTQQVPGLVGNYEGMVTVPKKFLGMKVPAEYVGQRMSIADLGRLGEAFSGAATEGVSGKILGHLPWASGRMNALGKGMSGLAKRIGPTTEVRHVGFEGGRWINPYTGGFSPARMALSGAKGLAAGATFKGLWDAGYVPGGPTVQDSEDLAAANGSEAGVRVLRAHRADVVKKNNALFDPVRTSGQPTPPDQPAPNPPQAATAAPTGAATAAPKRKVDPVSHLGLNLWGGGG